MQSKEAKYETKKVDLFFLQHSHPIFKSLRIVRHDKLCFELFLHYISSSSCILYLSPFHMYSSIHLPSLNERKAIIQVQQVPNTGSQHLAEASNSPSPKGRSSHLISSGLCPTSILIYHIIRSANHPSQPFLFHLSLSNHPTPFHTMQK